LRDNITAYDAMYVALAEAIERRIVTCDKRSRTHPAIALGSNSSTDYGFAESHADEKFGPAQIASASR